MLTTGALEALDELELQAVLAHERAHLRARHHLVLAVTATLQCAFRYVPVFRAANGELTRLVELHADDVAARPSDRRTVATALVRLAESSAPATALGAGGATALIRLRLLAGPSRPLGVLRSVLTAGGAIAMLVAPVAIVFAPAVAAAADVCPVTFPAA